MREDEIRATVLRVLGEIAPEVDPATIRPDVSFREQLDIDSMDFLNVLVALDKALHVDNPEGDYAQLTTVNDCVHYVAARLPAARE
jgi:acyl carrier protein